jgi:hypothetical protein
MTVGGKASLDGPYAKVRRAKEHLEAFELEVGVMEAAPDSTVFETRYDPDGQRFLVHVAEEPLVPTRLSAIAGDVIHNLRSALDLLAYQLPILASGTAWEDSQWPIVRDRKGLRQWRVKGLRKRLQGAHRADLWIKVEGYQAIGYEQQFKAGVDLWTQRYRDLPLHLLNALSNHDKHRLLLEPFINVAEFSRIEPRCLRDCRNPRMIESWGLWYTLKQDAAPLVQFTADITGPEPQMEVDIEFVPAPVGFSGLPGPAHEWLGLLAAKVLAVLEDFAPLF